MLTEYDQIKNLFLFYNIGEDECKKIIAATDPVVLEYRRGELVFSEESHEKCVGFVISGECEVRRKREGDYVILNTLKAFDSFGILSVFAPDEEFPTLIFARKNAAVMFFSEKDIRFLVEKYPQISLNVINFLSERIIFLNKRIATYSGSSTAEKLSAYLLSIYRENGCEFTLNCKRCSEALGVGRASVYRGIEALVSDGIIKFEDKKIKIICPEGLERN